MPPDPPKKVCFVSIFTVSKKSLLQLVIDMFRLLIGYLWNSPFPRKYLKYHLVSLSGFSRTAWDA